MLENSVEIATVKPFAAERALHEVLAFVGGHAVIGMPLNLPRGMTVLVISD
jgi:hypothetical protein